MIKVSMPRMSCRSEEAAVTKRFCEIAMRTQRIVLTAPLRIKVRVTTCGRDTYGKCVDETEVHLNDNALCNPFQYFTTLAHELIHVKQHYNGSLAAWRAATHPLAPYRNQPWEIEAFRDQGHLAWSVCSQMIAERKELAMGWGCHSGMLGEAFKHVSVFVSNDKCNQTFASFCVV